MVAGTSGTTAAARTRPPDGTDHTRSPSLIEIHDSLDPVACLWQQFEEQALTTLYQTHLWCRAWQDTVGRALGTSVRIAVLRDRSHKLRAILPFQIRCSAGNRILEWLGAPHCGYGYGVFAAEALRHAQDWAHADLVRTLDAIGSHDVALLTDMPEWLHGMAHPFRQAFTLRSANVSFQMGLDCDFEALHARKRDREDRRMARRKEALLTAIGPVRFELPDNPAALHATIDEMLDLHVARMAEIGVHGVASPVERAFFHRFVDLQGEGDPVLLPYRLSCGGRTLAVMLGGRSGGTFWALVSGLASGPERKLSPGDLALRKTIRACCEAGLSVLDFSAGDSRYKRAWADLEIPLHHHVSARTLKGLAFATLATTRITIKRTIKTSPVLFRLATDLRRRLLAR